MRTALAVCLSALLVSALSCDEPRKPLPLLDLRHSITVDGTSVRYNGRELGWNLPADRWQEVLGPRSRKKNVTTPISTWDELGLVLYEDPTDGTADSLVIFFGRTPHSSITTSMPSFWPNRPFPGRLVVDGALIHKDSSIQDIFRDKKGTSFGRSYLNTIFSYYQGDFHVALEFGHDRTLTDFSITKKVTVRAHKATKNRPGESSR